MVANESGFNVGIFILMVVLLVLSACFSASETVFSSVSTIKLKMLVEDGVPGSKKALSIAENFDKTLSTLLVGNNIVNITLATVAVGFFANIVRSKNLVEIVSTIVTTMAVLVFGEIIPKTLAKKNSEAIAIKIAILVYIFSIILYPFVAFFMLFQRLITGNKMIKTSVNEDELEAILDTMEEEGAIKSDDVKMIRNVFDMNNHTVEDIMTHRMDILAIDDESSIEEVKDILLENKYSRVPVFKQDKDHIIGILYERDFLSAYLVNKNLNLVDILKPVKYVSKAMKVDALMHELQKSKTHIAIVCGEYGDTVGLVTMEDCLEELVGEIYDEHDEGSSDTKLIEKIEENTYLVDGEIYVETLFEELNIGSHPESSAKLSTWIFENSQSLPEVGYKTTYLANYTQWDETEDDYIDFSKNIIFEVVLLDGRRIQTLKVTVLDNEDTNKE